MASYVINHNGGGGVDYTSHTAAIAAMPGSLSAQDTYTVTDAYTYTNTDETFPLNPSATATSTNYAIFEVNDANMHTGRAGTGSGITMDDSGGQHIWHLQSDYCTVRKYELKQSTPGSSDEGIRVQADYCWINRNILWTDSSTADTDGIYFGDWDVADCFIDHNVIYGWQRGGINLQNYNLFGAKDITAHVDYCTIVNCGASGEAESGGIHAKCRDSNSTTTVYVYNTYSGGTASTYPDFNDDGAANDSGTVSYNGTHNSCSDTSLTNEFGLTTGAQESVAVNTTQFTNVTGGSEDYSLPGTGSALYGVATSRVGSEPDSRQDFSIDILGNARSTTGPGPDIGAFEYTVGGATYTKTTSLDALLSKANNLKTASLDALLQKTITLQNSFDSLLLQTLTKTASLDAALKAQGLTKTASIDSLLKATGLTKTASFDALIRKTLTKTVDFDALLKLLGLTKTTSLDAVLRQNGLTKTASLDAVLTAIAANTKTTSLDALLLKQGITKIANLDAALQKTLTKTTSLDALLQKVLTLTTSIDALLKGTLTKTASLDAVVIGAGTNLITTSLDALLKQTLQLTLSVDALLRKNSNLLTSSIDATVIKRGLLTGQLDAILRKVGITVAISIDSVLTTPDQIYAAGLEYTLNYDDIDYTLYDDKLHYTLKGE